jgi:acyl dehydratase
VVDSASRRTILGSMDPAIGATTDSSLVDLRFDTIETGMAFGPVELVVSEQLVKSFAFATDDYAPVCGDAGVAHAAVLGQDLLRLLNTRFDPSTMVGLHQREELWIHSPVRVGERVVMTGRCVEKYVKNGTGYFVMEGSARSLGDDRMILSRRSSEIAEAAVVLPDTNGPVPRSERRVTGAVAPGREPVARAHASLKVGTPVVPLSKAIHQDQMSVFSNVGRYWWSIHSDLEQARRAGHERTVAQGLMQTMYVSQLGTQFFGNAWFTSGWVSTAYIKPVFEGDTLTVQAAVSDLRAEADQTRLELEVWIENENAVRTAVGWLSALVTP